MIELSPDVIDRRSEFEHRFSSIAAARSIVCHDLFRNVQSNESYSPAEDYSEVRAQSISNSGNKFATLVVPGLMGNSLRATVAPFLCAREKLAVKHYDIEVAWVHGRSGCGKNAESLRRRVLQAAEVSGAPVNLICYSKGCADALHMIGQYEDTHRAVRALVSFAGVVYGSPLADSASRWTTKALQYVPIPGEKPGDGRAIYDLTTEVRKQWLINHPIPSTIRLASVLAAPCINRVSRVLRGSYRKLSEINQYNDSQMIASDSLLPGSELLAVVNADHWAIALPIAEQHPLLAKLLVDKNEFPREVLLQAIIDHLQYTSPQSSSKHP